jgi:sporulation protein YlmC with PRC-barrel domain
MNIILNADVRCSDGEGGQAEALALNPATNVASHLVVELKGLGRHQVLLPLSYVAESSAKHITTSCTRAELAQMEPFIKLVRVEDQGLDAMDAQALVGAEQHSGVAFQDFSFAGAGSSEMVEMEAIPEAEIVVRHGIPVEATDGKAGEVDGFSLDPQSGQITGLVLREGHLFKKDVAIALDQIDRIGEMAVHLNIAKSAAK